MSRREFELMAIIDAAYYELKCLSEAYSKMLPKLGIEAAIDKATGYDTKRDIETSKHSALLMLTIIRSKRELGYDYSFDYEQYQQIKSIYKTLIKTN